MVKTPEEYFAEQSLEASPDISAALSPAEQAFVQKYLGSDALRNLPRLEPEQMTPDVGPATEADGRSPGDAAQNLRARLAEMEQLQMVSFYVRGQIYLLPVVVIVEVLRYMPLTRLPMAPRFMAGVINLRGKVTPLLHLDALLTTERLVRYNAQSCIIICGAADMQLGLIFDKLHTMYLVDRNRISWNVETYLGAGAEFLCGMADINDHLYAIVDPGLIVNKLLEE